MSDRDELGNFDPGRAIGQIPTKEVLISNDALSSNVKPWNQNIEAESVTVPDLKELGMNDMATQSLLVEKNRRQQEKIEHQMWQALFDVAEASDRKTLDAGGGGKFTDVLMDACQQLHKQGGTPDDAFLFMNGKTKGYVRKWIDEAMRFSDPISEDANLDIRVGGINFQPIVNQHPEPDQLVLVGDEMHAAPQTVPCVVINNLPIGVEIRIEVDGEDNNIVVN